MDNIEALACQIGRLEREIVVEAKRDEDMRRLSKCRLSVVRHGFERACAIAERF